LKLTRRTLTSLSVKWTMCSRPCRSRTSTTCQKRWYKGL